MISGGIPLDSSGKTCTNPMVLMENLCSVWSKDSTATRKRGDHWVAFSKTFQLMDDRYYTLQVVENTINTNQSVSQWHVVKLFNDRGMELGRVDRYPCYKSGVQGSFERSLDLLMMEEALEKATGQLVPVQR